MIHQKTSQNAIAAMSRLAELYAVRPTCTLSSREIAESRNLPTPIVAKILTILSRAGYVTGSPGPGGGYRLAKKPSLITLKEVMILFERESESMCPFGPGWCGNQEPCPLHETIADMEKRAQKFLTKTTFAAFVKGEPSVPITGCK
ncbi:RrF2 family transcriptional regulator [Novipirellula artificiosorum]|uniref:HTH-type transcriptional regulator IscR n=1 Tax=Novipirellula artificiosorum TaxID=2528016 RepID=A0A5C6DAL5_9BACT|nr:Rrf2 family transcriptional regulator [Novipirellula artificiosorum]TWU33932.1 HTH-type transcriptional regulator IscR [Novipirellula artificiosorum]